jgi:hypothetical protein
LSHSLDKQIRFFRIPHIISCVVKFSAAFFLVEVPPVNRCAVLVYFNCSLDVLKVLVFWENLYLPRLGKFVLINVAQGTLCGIYFWDEGGGEFLFFKALEIVISQPYVLFEFVCTIKAKARLRVTLHAFVDEIC